MDGGMKESGAPTWIWSWGAGTRGQLASAAFVDSWEPLLLSSFAEDTRRSTDDACPNIVDMACGGAHAVAILNEGYGQIVTWGSGDSGCLGHGDASDLSVPKLLNFFNSIRVCSVGAGWSHTAFATESGELYTCGNGSFGQLGLGDFDMRLVPCRVEALASKAVSKVVCGMRHTLVLAHTEGTTEGLAVYSFGSAKRGQLGIPTLDYNREPHQSGAKKVLKVAVPKRIPSLDGRQVILLKANGDRSAAVSVAETGDLYLWGRGFDNKSDASVPLRVDCKFRISNVALGWNHGLALTDDGLLWAWGCNDRGQLGALQDAEPQITSMILETNSMKDSASTDSHEFCDSDQHWLKLRRVDGLEERTVICISAGSEHSTAVLDSGEIMVWGWGEHGQLGLGTADDQPCPQVIPLSSNTEGKLGWRTFCGSGFTFAVAQLVENH